MSRPPGLSGKKCYHCGSTDTWKRGFHKQKQRYFCLACRRGFRDDPETRIGERYRMSPNRILPSAGRLILELHTIAQRLGRTPTVSDITSQFREGRSNSIKVY